MKPLEKLIEKIVHVFDEKQASNIRVYDVSAYSSLADAVVVVGAKNKVHCRALLEAVQKGISESKSEYRDEVQSLRTSGKPDSGWVVLDTGSVIIHMMEEDLREMYELDRVFENRSVVYHH